MVTGGNTEIIAQTETVRADLHGTILSHATTAYDRPTT